MYPEVKQFLEFVLPSWIIEYFDIISSETIWETLRVTLEEKNHPPIDQLPNWWIWMKVKSKWFKNIRVDDYPIRWKKVELMFKRRYWKVEWQDKYLKRDINICFPWTQLEKEFAVFLKELYREQSDSN